MIFSALDYIGNARLCADRKDPIHFIGKGNIEHRTINKRIVIGRRVCFERAAIVKLGIGTSYAKFNAHYYSLMARAAMAKDFALGRPRLVCGVPVRPPRSCKSS